MSPRSHCPALVANEAVERAPSRETIEERAQSVDGKTDATGRAVVDGEAGPAELFATIYRALGIDHQKQFMVGARPVPLTETGTEPIRAVLA